MKIPKPLALLLDEGIVDRVVQTLKSGKEADVFLVVFGGEVCCAKVYKQRNDRSFSKQTAYQEGRKTQNSRRARAMARKSRFGKKEKESDWQSAEVDALYTLQAADIRVPRPHLFLDGVLLMEAVSRKDATIAPPLSQVTLSESEAEQYHASLIRDAVKMLCAGIIHGDLSEFNILLSDDGPVIIDLPQWVNAAANSRARDFFLRDIANLRRYFSRFCPHLETTKYGKEIWHLYSRGELTPFSPLSGIWEESSEDVDTGETLFFIRDAEREEMERRERLAEDLE
ncbi:MAG: PA4780 family RIO1-like protein kinase [Fibrobacterota bacterium]